MSQRGHQLIFTDPIEAELFLNNMDGEQIQEAFPLQQRTPHDKQLPDRRILETSRCQKYPRKNIMN